jgi:predicted aldo/keto reductase-like oxidoreductase
MPGNCATDADGLYLCIKREGVMKRRDIFKAGLAAVAASVFNSKLFAKVFSMDQHQKLLPKRRYADEVDLSVIGLGGIVVVGMQQKDADQIVAESVDAGVNYFDVAPSYWDGEAEEKLGRALQPYRNDIFLACKTMARNANGAEEELNISLKRIGVQHFDLYQFHAVTTLEEVEEIFGPGGAAEAFLKAQQAGKIRFIGFSAHSEEAALALLEQFEFNSVLFPVNFVNYGQSNFGPVVVERARAQGAAVLALKAMAYTPWPEGAEKTCQKCWYKPVEDPDLAEKALRFTLSQDITAAIPPGDENLYRLALKIARNIRPMDSAEQEEILAATKGLTSLFPL